MGHKGFISYKYKDNNVSNLDNYSKGTARDYVDYLQDNKFSGDDLNKAENDEDDLSEFKDETIRTKLKEKIWDSSATIVLISPNMVDHYKSQNEQWIPWEISYSLRSSIKNNSRSLPNAVLAVVLPDQDNNYDYFITYRSYQDDDGNERSIRTIHTGSTFEIIANNMFNQKNPVTENIQGRIVYFGDSSYIATVKWDDFISDVDTYLESALSRRDHISDYKIKVNM
ncbi:TIR domain-containing protein [Leuconostoc gasicomitatum]|uniref:TIR domain-containing protein n=1 Tax=Leuconostoc gasicomitatum TaxID=115778 RepID=UPI001CC6C17A|nr:TIR domain-containing protein [Leuconostoc gasicomitatum]MBZ5969356.1 TIR domain-containing protein [Leuconostoc gasicomitatum]MBZ5997888.1 TIR domain-containing protein [Leuconostoc gasicomitatum]